ncbi:MAG TPA: hypothetical protein VJH03_17010 [Blastocatellia bacterium]|nr:hypothetical protein [Blastocatellia bacterium]
MSQESSCASLERLRGLARIHEVCYETWPEFLMVRGQRVKVGFLLELNGVHGPGADHIRPGCEHCRRTFEDLRDIAEWIMPEEERASYYDVEPFDNALRETPKRKFRLEVVLGVRILHRHGFDQPVDECEERCLKEMRQKLAELGVREGAWHPERVTLTR